MSIGITQMNSLLSSANMLKSVSNLNTANTSLSGQSRILASEIEADKGRGIDTERKEKMLAEMEGRLQDIGEKINGSLSELNEQIESDREKISDEEAEHVSETKNTINADGIMPGITKSVDTMQISPEAKAAAKENGTGQHETGQEVYSHVTSEFSQSKGKVIDKTA